MNMRLLIPLLCLGFSGVLYANEVPPSHPMATMSDTELEAVTDHDQGKEDAEESSPHTHGDKESLLNTVRLKTDQQAITISQSIAPPSIQSIR
jgi:hypothetical protein